MECLPKAEILVRDEVHGLGSRSSGGAFERPKASRGNGIVRQELLDRSCQRYVQINMNCHEGLWKKVKSFGRGSDVVLEIN